MRNPWPTKMDTHLHYQNHCFLLHKIQLILALSIVKQFKALGAAEIQIGFILAMPVEFSLPFLADQFIWFHFIVYFIILKAFIFIFPPRIFY